MSRAANPSVIGAFVLGAVFLGVAAALLFGSGTFFEKRNAFVLYFDHSVQGLDVGSPVIFQGVEIGTVTSISALVNQETRVVAIPVYIETVQGRVQVIGPIGDSVGGVQLGIENGLRARLKSLSLITGKLYVDLDYYPDKPAVFKHLDPETPEIPTIPSELEELRASFQGFFHKIEKLPLSELVDKLASAADSLDKLLKKPELDDAIDQLDGTLTEARGTLTKLNARVDPLADSVEATLKRARSAIQAAQEAVAAVKGMVEPGSSVQYELIAALEEVERAARSVRMLADGLSQQPNSVIFGKEKAGN
jgi:paraquat-inducible protein B